jgi:alginate O-acetyltransferase complex protein AlgI
MGLFEKVVFADSVAPFATTVFDGIAATRHVTFVEAWIGTIAYSFQVYFDFSGYSDMAIGMGCLFGVTLRTNFNSPYRTHRIIDFWRRWHITLSRFLRDYLYFPLGGNTKGKSRRYVNLMLTMLLGGMWHGAG